MNNQKSLLNNYIFNFIKTFSNLAFPIITFIYASQILGAEGIGKVSFSKSIGSYFIMIAMLGMNYYGTREAAKIRDNKFALSKFSQEMIIINAITTVISVLLLVVCLTFIPKLQEYKELLLICCSAVILQGLGMEWLYQAIEEYRFIAVRTVAFQIISFVAMILFVRKSTDVIAYMVILVLASSGSYILNFLHIRRFIYFQRFPHYDIKKHIKPLFKLFAIPLTIELYAVLDSTILGFLQNDIVVGKYTAAVKVDRMANNLITAIGVVLISRLSYYIGNGKQEQINDLVERAYNYIFMLSVPIAIGLFVLSDEIILLFCGSNFYSAGFTMRLLSPIVIVIPFSMATNQYTFAPMGKEKQIIISTTLGAVTNFIFDMLLIPNYAENGAAIATVFAETIVAFVCYGFVRQYFNMRYIFKKYYQYWIAAIPIPIIAILFRSFANILKIILTVFLSTGCYFFMLWLQKNPYLFEVIKRLQNNFKVKETIKR